MPTSKLPARRHGTGGHREWGRRFRRGLGLLPRRLGRGRRWRDAWGAVRLLGPERSLEDHLAAARLLMVLRQHRRAVAILNRAERELGTHGALSRLRRTIPGYVGSVDRRHVREAATAATGRPVDAHRVVDVPVTGGLSSGTVAIVRHVVTPDGVTFLRKSTHRTHRREALLYRSGLVSQPGQWWRAPRVLWVGEDEAHWHLFLEDLRTGIRPRTVADFVHTARGLGELNGQFRTQPVPEVEWLAMRPTYSLRGHSVGIRACRPFLERSVGNRLLATYRRFTRQEDGLAARYTSLPTTLCHGDAHAGNVLIDPSAPEQVVLIDWSMAHLGPVGADLGRLLTVPYMSLGRDLDPEACVAAYRSALGAPPEAEDQVLFAVRYSLVCQSLRWWATRPQLSQRRLHPGDVHRICDAAEELLAAV